MSVRMKLNILTIALLAFGTWSCQTEEVPVLEATPVIAEAPTCPKGTARTFGLNPIPAGEMEYTAPLAFRLSTDQAPFRVTDCLCEIQRFEFIFGSLPMNEGEGEVYVKDANNVGIPFEINPNLNAPYKTIVIWRPAEIVENTMDVYIDFEHEPYVSAFVRAGGLCIINNLDGTGSQPIDPNLVFDEPLKVYGTTGFNNMTPFPRWEAYIPTVITDEP